MKDMSRACLFVTQDLHPNVKRTDVISDWSWWRRNVKSQEATGALSFWTFSNLQNILEYTCIQQYFSQ